MNLIDFYREKAQILEDYQERTYDREDAESQLEALGRRAKSAGLPVATGTKAIATAINATEQNEDSYESSYDESW
jgi:hypothetical protein